MSPAALLERRDDEAVVAAIRAGEPVAFDVLVARHRAAMVAYARRILGERGASAEDVVQEALIRAHRALGRDSRDIVLRPWLMTVVRNCALDEVRRVRTYPLPDEPGAEPAAAESGAPEQVLGRRARLRSMVEDVSRLPTEQRHALLRHAVDGAAHADIGAELGVSPEASRMLVSRARAELTRIEAARDERCDTVREAIERAHRSGRRASAHAHRHLLGCSGCREYRRRLKALDGALRLLHPGPALASAAAAGASAGAVAAKSGLAGAGGLAAALAGAAIGATVLFGPGDPSPLTMRSPALPGATVRAGQPIPPGTSVVARRVRVGSGVSVERFRCPAGQVVADLLPPAGGRTDVAYARSTVPGRSRVARVRLRGRASGPTGLAILCRRPSGGSIIPGAAAVAAAVCARRVHLRRRPSGPIEATARFGQPVARLQRTGRWVLVRTDLGDAGWLRAGVLCGG